MALPSWYLDGGTQMALDDLIQFVPSPSAPQRGAHIQSDNGLLFDTTNARLWQSTLSPYSQSYHFRRLQKVEL